MIVSGNRLACFEPQEVMWKGESGQAFNLAALISQSSDLVASLNGLAGFDLNTVKDSGFSRTIFRLPLRREASGLSHSIYSIQKLTELLDALREEAKYLLLFLKSVCKIEVLHISQAGEHDSFCVKITPDSFSKVLKEHNLFLQQLKRAHKRDPYRITDVISNTVELSVIVTDNNQTKNQSGTSSWLITNYVGSTDSSVQAAAAELHILPWVGAALELGGSSAGGRIFCFLPMPIETSSGLPIHIHGTFGLNDERRTLKWPGVERKNDPTANWNKVLVSKLLPPCYSLHLAKAKEHFSNSPEKFYKAWPDVQIVKRSDFAEILKPLFTELFKQAVIWAEKTVDLQLVGSWLHISNALEGSSLSLVLKKVLSNCGVQLSSIPEIVSQAIHFTGGIRIKAVSPSFVRSKLRDNPDSYSDTDSLGKRVILSYCLSDRVYHDLKELKILPLVDGKFTTFDNSGQLRRLYLCSADCPQSLLPNLEHMLVNVSDDSSLQKNLYKVAASKQTRLRVLNEMRIAYLLPKAMPSDWRNKRVVSMPHSLLPSTWLETFWSWVTKKNLDLFMNLLLVPCYSSTSDSVSSFYLSCLDIEQPVVFVSTSYTSCTSDLLSAFYKMNIRICLQKDFSFVIHSQLFENIKRIGFNNVLDVIASQKSFSDKCFTVDEADSLRTFLLLSLEYSTDSPSSSRKKTVPPISKKIKAVLQSLAIFSSASNSHSQIHSVNSVEKESVLGKALVEPSDCVFSMSNFPPDLILFSRENHHQLQLLRALQIQLPSDFELLVNHIFPLIRKKNFPDNLIDSLMSEILDMSHILNSRESNSDLSIFLKDLPFVKTLSSRKSPIELFDPLNANIAALYDGEDVFPLAPYNTPQRIQVLISCGLCAAVSAQHVIDIIYSISFSASSNPQQVNVVKIRRAKAVLDYVSSPHFHIPAGKCCSLPELKSKYSFPDALKQLATSRSWLPVLSDRPSDYCDKLPWKGSDCSSHLVCLSNSVVLSSTTAHTLPHLVGSQMYIVSPTVTPKIAAVLSADSADISKYVVVHFKRIIACKDQIPAEVMDFMVHKVYHYMNGEGLSSLQQLHSIKEWIYIKRENNFKTPAVVALRQNPTFRRDLEPYIYILSDSLTQYTNLLGETSEVPPTVSPSQILSVLKLIQDNVQEGMHRTAPKEAWRTVMSILNWLTEDGTKSVSSDIAAADILVPIEAESEWPQLVQASEVVYTDNEFLKEYFQFSEEKECHMFVHSHISNQLAHLLGVIPLSEQLDISEDTFEDAGQHEPLTIRLKNILTEYKDGLTIIKELLQNADDAEATEVNICYDVRQHETDPKKLYFSGMTEAHGPALVVHNNSTFSDDDFKNITMLAAATKKGEALKIGKFGIGFCSVYHMTDVPSFISRDQFYIFDPTLSYLRKEVKNSAQPGKKTKFNHTFLSHSRQLDPFNGLFGFDRSKSYPGTMFRLPFRTHASELSTTCYTEATINELILAIRESSAKLLLFLQHVKTITFQRIDPGQIAPVVVLKISKKTVPLPFVILCTKVEQITCTDSELAHPSSCNWLVSHKSEKKSEEKYFTASIACPIGSSQCYKVDPKFEGEMFCFLPLSQKTGLPVHVSSNFAVINNRRGIWASDDTTSQTDKEVVWNIELMKGVIADAYYALLVAAKELSRNGLLSKYSFHNLWPITENLLQHNPWAGMIEQLYKLVSFDQLFYSDYLKQWLHLNESKFLTPRILCQSSEQSSTPNCVLTVLQYLNTPIVDLPIVYHKYFNLNHLQIDESAFIKLFLKKLDDIEVILSTRSEVIQYMLEVYAAEYDDETERSYMLDGYFKEYASIPCTPDGKILRKCADTIDPTAVFAPLFESSEGYFPLSQLSDRRLCYTALGELGMISETLPIDMLVERAEAIPKLYKTDKFKALKCIRLILDIIKTFKKADMKRSMLSSIPFLPVLPKPKGYYFTWRGDNFELMCSKDLMTAGRYYHRDRNSYIAGTQIIFVNEQSIKDGGCGYITDSNLSLLEIRKAPSIREVIDHLNEIQKDFQSQTSSTEELILHTSHICRHAYDFLDRNVKVEAQPVSSEHEPLPPTYINLRSQYGVAHVWTGRQFVEIEKIAREWNIDGPYLFPWPSSVSFQMNLIKSLELKDLFTFQDIQRVLEEMGSDFGENPIDKHCQNMLIDIVALLQKCDLDSIQNPSIMLPDTEYVLCRSNTLNYVDTDWAPKDPNYRYVNEIVPQKLAKQLGVRALRSKMLEKYSIDFLHYSSVIFGQHEKLTTRIQTILQDYPLDITLLKELLQNAEDAKATKVYVILDCRTHGSKGVFSENWKKLQGPALLVWNDSVFSEEDLLGIQRLGLGSKKYDSETIGRYGIGFNVVYHLTDCPSFITGGETLCVLDPHCKYVNEANERYPGRRYNISSPEFWEQFCDVGSTFFRSGLDECPPELYSGSLFRFPLRNTVDHLKSSEIIKKDERGNPLESPLTFQAMNDYLNEWAPQLKKSMLFLTSVKELHFMIIVDNSHNSHKLQTLYKYCAVMDDLALKRCEEFRKSLSSFKSESGYKPKLIRYPLTLSSTPPGKEKSVGEKWLIQQGVGDIENEQQKWTSIDSLKPRHGIAALLHPSFLSEEDGSGQVFCFLPLPIKSKLPVHINGNFILHANRRSLWKPSEPDVKDVNSLWNDKIFQALASSYAVFLDNAREHYVSQSLYNTQLAEEVIKNYYRIFPNTQNLDVRFQLLAKNVYSKVVALKSSILAVIDHGNSSCNEFGTNVSNNDSKNVRVLWHPLKSDNPSSQVYFADFSEKREDLRSIVEDIGMKLTAANASLQQHLNAAIPEAESKLRSTSPKTVFEFYISHYAQVIQTRFPCAIKNTVFRNVSRFKRFTQYLLVGGSSKVATAPESVSGMLLFPEDPFNQPLLLTADSMLRMFSENGKVIKSYYSHLFPKAQQYFLHPDFVDIDYLSTYFPSYSDIPVHKQHSLKVVHEIFSLQLPNSLKENEAELSEEFSQGDLIALWECLATDKIFLQHQSELLKEWALLPGTSGKLYSCGNHFEPVVPLEISEETDEIHIQMYELLQLIKMPFLDTTVIPEGHDALSLSCPNLRDEASILKVLYYLNQNSTLNFTKENVQIVVSYLKKVEFRFKPNNRKYVRSLSLFESVDGEFKALNNTTTYVWPARALYTGFSKCSIPDAIFLLSSSSWKDLDSAENLDILEITEEALYYKIIFKSFPSLTEQERYKHLIHIRDFLFPFVELNASKEASIFKQALTDLLCIEDKNSHMLRPVKECFNNKVTILKIFSMDFQPLPDIFAISKSWEKWLEFFKKLGLKHTVTKNEFLQYCKDTADKIIPRHIDIETASTALLDHLFSESVLDWHTDNRFLEEVADLPFVPTEPVPELTWIHKAAEKNKQVRLNEAVTHNLSVYLWTVKPVIRLLEGWQGRDLLLEQLGVIHKAQQLPTVMVVQNLLNICRSYDVESANQPPEGGITLMQVMGKHFEFLQQHLSENDSIDQLRDTPCIPVNFNEDDQHVILVKPSFVLLDGELKEFHPYLHQLNPQLLSSASFLRKIGVEPGLSFRHLQLVLEQAYVDSREKELEQEAKRCVSAAVRKLFQFLSGSLEDEQVEKISNMLSPLYLPNHKGKLAPSKELLYADRDIFEGIQPQLEGTVYSLLRLERALDKGILLEKDICAVLPEQLKPIPLSSVCTLAVAKECQPTDHTSVGAELQAMLARSELLSVAMTFCIQHFVKHNLDSDSIKGTIHQYLSSISVISYQSLQIAVTFNATREIIGIIEYKYFLEESLPGSVSRQLCLDARLNKKTIVVRALSNYLFLLLKKKFSGITNESLNKLSDIVIDIFESKNSDEVVEVLEDSHIFSVSERLRTKFRESIPRAIPNPDEGKRWLKQAEANFKSLIHLHSGIIDGKKLEMCGEDVNSEIKKKDAKNLEMCADVCFMAHQVAEKALKGAQYFIHGFCSDSHNLKMYASSLENKCPYDTVGLVSHAAPLDKYYLCARYPDMWNPPKIPSEKYLKVDADDAKDRAEAILEIVKKLIHS